MLHPNSVKKELMDLDYDRIIGFELLDLNNCSIN